MKKGTDKIHDSLTSFVLHVNFPQAKPLCSIHTFKCSVFFFFFFFCLSSLNSKDVRFSFLFCRCSLNTKDVRFLLCFLFCLVFICCPYSLNSKGVFWFCFIFIFCLCYLNRKYCGFCYFSFPWTFVLFSFYFSFILSTLTSFFFFSVIFVGGCF